MTNSRYIGVYYTDTGDSQQSLNKFRFNADPQYKTLAQH